MTDERARDQLTIRGVDRALWQQLRVEAVQLGVGAGELLNALLAERYRTTPEYPPIRREGRR